MIVECGGFEDAATTFARDQWAMLRAAADGVATARLWKRPAPGLLLGRFHRLPAAAPDGPDAPEAPEAGTPPVSRRLSGGRVVPVGPDVLCVSVAAPVVDWLDPAGASLKPQQVLNRGLRPLLELLRSDGVDVFYPGRDLVTAGGRALAHASFTVARDGVVLVEMHVAEGPAFEGYPELAGRLDPEGTAAADRDAWSGATSLAGLSQPARDLEAWAEAFAGHVAGTLNSDVRSSAPAAGSGMATMASADAFADFLAWPGAEPEAAAGGERISAAAIAMLGVVECSASRRGDRVTGLRLSGDLIAPFHTVEDIAAECEGQPLRGPNIRKALARALGRPRSFLLGIAELDELLLRMA